MSNIHFLLQGKGGVGKTLNCSLLTQYLNSFTDNNIGIDTDSVNHTYAQYGAYNVKKYGIYNSSTSYLDESVIEDMANFIYNADNTNIIIDNGASSFVPLLQYLTANQVISLLEDAGHNVYIHTIITGGQGMADTIGGLGTLLSCFPETPLVVWLNYKFGDIGVDGKSFDEWNVYKRNKKNIPGIIPIDFPSGQLFQQDIEFMLTNKLTFDEAMKQSSLFSRNRLKQMKEHVFTAIQATDLPCFIFDKVEN